MKNMCRCCFPAGDIDDSSLVGFQNHKGLYSDTFSKYSNIYELKSQNNTYLSGSGFYDQPKWTPRHHPQRVMVTQLMLHLHKSMCKKP